MLREITHNGLFTILLVIGIALVAIAKLTDPKRFNDFIYVIGNSKYLKIYSRDQKFFDKFDALLFCNLIICGATFLYILFRYFTNTKNTNINLLFKMGVGIGAFILIKVLIERLIASLFEIDKLVDNYIFQKISYKNYIGILLLPINAILLYKIQVSLTVIYIMVIILLIANVIGIITSFKMHQSFIKNYLFYFILYLCALEITPYLILYKVFMS
ncbi:DUF4271 domain-containing protein [Seonamhaeicola algicola]|uniref:DUF4271 domain-containing protein n=2 Tax=Seonamhaeicola TaxID=1649495 RepID=A0A5C7AMS9_9FLAO|nr:MULTISPECIES: DUF4271 domain-containing protein [Seonamhaeicola]TXE09631.1 DUF4271 domain-containing protein [Seonamhaeicola algicola]TYA96691.1 DUF4271 domain-containing protein [Seonamhaeicola marinus]